MVAAAQQARDNLPDDDTTVATEAPDSVVMSENPIEVSAGPSTRRETLSKFYKGEIDLSDADKKELALNPSSKHEASSRMA